MAKKQNKNIFIIIGIVALAIILLSYKAEGPMKTGTSNKGVDLKVYGWKDGEKVGLIGIQMAGQLYATV